MTDYDLKPEDLKRLEQVAEKITGPIVELVAVLAAERDAAVTQGDLALDELNRVLGLLNGLASVLEDQGWSPTFVADRDAWEEAQRTLALANPARGLT